MRWWKGIVLMTVSLLAVFTLILFSSILCVLYSGGKKDVRNKQYRMLRVNPSGNELKRGFVTLVESLEEEDSIFYKDDDGSQVLISNFKSKEYACHGSCSCESEAGRRSSHSSILSRSATFLVAAFSSIVAFNKAREYFKEECVSLMSEECPISHVESILDGCEDFEMLEGLEGWEEYIKERGEEYARKDKEEYPDRKYYCKGNCLTSKFDDDPGKYDRAKRFNCEKMELREEVEVDCTYDSRGNHLARTKFIKEILDSFCQDNSKESGFDMYIDDIEADIFGDFDEEEYDPLCRGAYVGLAPFGGDNPTVECVLTYPKKTHLNIYWD